VDTSPTGATPMTRPIQSFARRSERTHRDSGWRSKFSDFEHGFVGKIRDFSESSSKTTRFAGTSVVKAAPLDQSARSRGATDAAHS
jgi:hypothetical protein